MKLYRVSVEHTFYMTAEDDMDAAVISEGYAQEAISDACPVDLIIEQQVESIDEVPEEWRKSLVYGDHAGDLTCEQVLASSGR